MRVERLVESMTKAHLKEYVVRVWREEDLKYVAIKEEQEQFIKFIENLEGYAPMQIAEIIMQEPNINAVEVLDKNSNGIVVYSNWP